MLQQDASQLVRHHHVRVNRVNFTHITETPNDLPQPKNLTSVHRNCITGRVANSTWAHMTTNRVMRTGMARSLRGPLGPRRTAASSRSGPLALITNINECCKPNPNVVRPFLQFASRSPHHLLPHIPTPATPSASVSFHLKNMDAHTNCCASARLISGPVPHLGVEVYRPS